MIGGYGSIPLQVGGGLSVHEVEHQALLDAYAPGWDKGEATESAAEAYAHARILTVMWAVTQRIANQAIPMRMLEALPEWEKILKLRPHVTDDENTRRSRVAAKLRGIVGNTLGDISDVSRAVFGLQFVQIVTPDPSETVTYWPGVNPGPPGFEYMSTRALIGIRVNSSGLSLRDFITKRNTLGEQIRDMKPSWLQFVIGVGDEFVVNQGIVGQTLI